MYGLVLEGGGAKGSYHVGVYKALRELNIEIGGVTGTSIGALNGAAIVQGDFDKLVDLWKEAKVSNLFDVDEKILKDIRKWKFDKENVPYILQLSKDIFNNGGLETTKIIQLISKFIDENKVRESNMDFGIVTLSLTDRKALELFKEDIPKGKMVDYLMASSYLPVFKMEKLDGKNFLDGAYYDNMPINLIMQKGYKNIIAVRTLSRGRVRKVKIKKKDNINITYIQPNEDLGRTLDFDPVQAERNMKLGYFDCIKTLKGLKGYKYYLEPYQGDFMEFVLKNITKEKIKRIRKILGFEKIYHHRMLFEKIIPRVEMLLDMKGKNDYEDIAIRGLELIAEKYSDIDQFRIYTFEEFLNLIIKKYIKRPIRKISKVPDFIKHNQLLSYAVRDDIIVEIFKELIREAKI